MLVSKYIIFNLALIFTLFGCSFWEAEKAMKADQEALKAYKEKVEEQAENPSDVNAVNETSQPISSYYTITNNTDINITISVDEVSFVEKGKRADVSILDVDKMFSSETSIQLKSNECIKIPNNKMNTLSIMNKEKKFPFSLLILFISFGSYSLSIRTSSY